MLKDGANLYNINIYYFKNHTTARKHCLNDSITDYDSEVLLAPLTQIRSHSYITTRSRLTFVKLYTYHFG